MSGQCGIKKGRLGGLSGCMKSSAKKYVKSEAEAASEFYEGTNRRAKKFNRR